MVGDGLLTCRDAADVSPMQFQVVMQVFASKNFRDWRLTLRALAHLIAVLQTGTTDIPLTAEGERLISDLSSRAVGPGSRPSRDQLYQSY